MTQPPLHVLVHGVPPSGLGTVDWGPCLLRPCADLDAVSLALAEGVGDALLLHLPDPAAAGALAAWPGLVQAVVASAVVVLTETPTPDLLALLIERGVQDVLPADADPAVVGRVLLAAVLRHRLARDTRQSWSTDLATGLPNQAQLLEHTNHLLALRQREPAPMALLAVRVEGLLAAQSRLGPQAAAVLRRKLAVRLRAAVRASDVVASLGADAFAVLLAWIDAPAAAERVATKLERALTRPLQVEATTVDVGISVGVGHYPDQGRDAGALLRLALSQAATAPAAWRTATAAANDPL